MSQLSSLRVTRVRFLAGCLIGVAGCATGSPSKVQSPAAARLDANQPAMVTRVYDVRDLLETIPDFDDAPNLASGTTRPSSQPDIFTPRAPTSRDAEVTRLIESVRQCIPAGWEDGGMIRERSGQLLVRQTGPMHARVTSFLDGLREQRTTQITVEARFISFNEEAVKIADEIVRSSAETATNNGTSTKQAGTVLNDVQVNEILRAAETDGKSEIVTAPRITLFNGQRAYVLVATQHPYVADYKTVNVGEGKPPTYDPQTEVAESGVKLDVRAMASADRRNVRLELSPQLSKIVSMKEFAWPGRPVGSELKVQQPELDVSEIRSTVDVPDGGTILFTGLRDLTDAATGGAKAPATRPAAPGRRVILLVRPVVITGSTEQKSFPLLTTKASSTTASAP